MVIFIAVIVAIIIYVLYINRKLKNQIAKLTNENKELKGKIATLVGKENNDQKDLIDLPVDVKVNMSSSVDDTNKYDDKIWHKYDEILSSQPDFQKYIGRPFDYPSYTDKYDTGTEFTLRQLLLLVWWGRFKKGRMINSRIPKYFFSKYNLNGPKVTDQFVKKGWLIEKDDRYKLSDEAKEVAKFHEDLWDMHQVNMYPICLDEDFPNWNDGKLMKSFYKNEIEYLGAQITYNNKLIWLYKTYPKFFNDKIDQQSSIDYAQHIISNDQKSIEDYKAKIEALE